MAPLTNENENESKGDFKDQQFGQKEVADKVVEQCKFILSVLYKCCTSTYTMLLPYPSICAVSV